MCICVCLCKVCVLYCQQGRPLNGESQVKSRRRPVLVLALQQPIKTMLRAKLVSLFVCICNWVAILLKLSLEVYSVHCTYYFGIHEKKLRLIRRERYLVYCHCQNTSKSDASTSSPSPNCTTKFNILIFHFVLFRRSHYLKHDCIGRALNNPAI